MDPRRDAHLTALLACPVCKGALDASSDDGVSDGGVSDGGVSDGGVSDGGVSDGGVSCASCGRHFPQPGEGYLDLLPDRLLERDESRWHERQQEMEAWYQDLIADPAWATSCFADDYDPYAPLLATLSGRILDLGGGNGVARHYLPREVQYVVVDPSLDWLGDEWKSIAEHFPSLETRPLFVRGVGEHLPFAAQTFDAVLAFWSLNHVSRPEQVFREVSRVLKPGGLFLAVLEEMEPRWRDVLDPSFRRYALPQVAWSLLQRMKPGLRRLLRRLLRVEKIHQAAAVLIGKLRARLPGRSWPTQSDHLRLRESDLQRWSARRFGITRRAWVGRYLTYEFRKPASSAKPVQR